VKAARARRLLFALGLSLSIPPEISEAGNFERIERGRYLFDAAGCYGCHTDTKNKGMPLAGGRALKTPFGVFFSPNITPDKENGIGEWSDADFIRALRHGKNPDGVNYFPVFPYASYTRLADGDILDIKAYLFSLPADPAPNRPHRVSFFFGSRFMVNAWNVLNLKPGPMQPVPTRSAAWNRGAYLVEALGHCGECHTPRDSVGGFKRQLHLSGTKDGPGGETMPNITPDKKTGIGKWPDSDLKDLFSLGMLPDGDFVGGGMAEFVTHTSSKWTKEDTASIIVYLRSLAPVRNQLKTKKKESGNEWD
jgi:mono/diheme cytochrome c family protein